MTMKVQQQSNTWSMSLFLSCVILLCCAVAQAQKKSKYACEEERPRACAMRPTHAVRLLLRAGLTLPGQGIRQREAGIPTRRITNCLHQGWYYRGVESSNKNNGFTVSFGADLRFDPDTRLWEAARSR